MRKIYPADHDEQYMTAMSGQWVNRLDKLHGFLVTGQVHESKQDAVEESVTKRLLMLRNAVNFRLFELGYDTHFTNQLDKLEYPAKRVDNDYDDDDADYELPPLRPTVKESKPANTFERPPIDSDDDSWEPYDSLLKVKEEFRQAMERWTNMFELSEPERDELLDL